MRGLQSFYRSFYGDHFSRNFRRPPDYGFKHFKIQFTVENSKNLYGHVHRNSGHHPCFAHVYDYGSKVNLKKKDSSKMVFDRAFFDFDVSNPKARKIKNKLLALRYKGPLHQKEEQEGLVEQLRKLIIDDQIAKPAIDESKDFAVKFKETFGREPALFFSGCKGCHAYAFFRASSFQNINMALSWFAEHIKNNYNYQTLDLSVNRDAMARLSRVPYSKHQLTNLSVVPFSIKDSYEDIIEKSVNPRVEEFNREDFTTDFHKHLQKIDLVEAYNAQVNKLKLKRKVALSRKTRNQGRISDHRIFFRNLLGDPEREYLEKRYNMYNCPLPGHVDKKPSFMVHEKGYYCYGCQKKGNYWQFYKDLHGWTDDEVRSHLKK